MSTGPTDDARGPGASIGPGAIGPGASGVPASPGSSKDAGPSGANPTGADPSAAIGPGPSGAGAAGPGANGAGTGPGASTGAASTGAGASSGPGASGGIVVGGVRARVARWWRKRNDRTQQRWQAALHGEHGRRVRRTWLLIKVVLVQARYALSYVATGYLVSGPLQIGLSHQGHQQFYKSIVLGLVFLVPALLLVPLTRVDWHQMRLPEFKVLERGLARWSAGLSLLVLLLVLAGQAVLEDETGVRSVIAWLCDRHVAWINLSLMSFALVRAEIDAWLFPEFYALRGDDPSLVLFSSSLPRPVDLPGASGPPAPAVPTFGAPTTPGPPESPRSSG